MSTALRLSTVLVVLGVLGTVPTGTATAADLVPAPGRIFTGQVFDACTAPALSTMDAWKADPANRYGGVGVYVGGSSRACDQPQLTAAWVAAVDASGWSIVPIYAGAQAPDRTSANRINAATATSQGRADGAEAAGDAGALGIAPGSPVYLDMEAYDQKDPTVAAAVLDYTRAWDAAMHAEGYRAGFYSSADSGITAMGAAARAGTTDLPDDLWIARWVGDTSKVITSTSDPVLPDTLWTGRTRSRQYLGGHTVTLGGVALGIDTSYWDAPVAVVG
ncbi:MULTISPECIES: DUF1906 domain-containing protein [Streptacidiphilus]|uniref:DUF1906 domain-containing protein n=1 Tax=Streptacidiphilus cavernicola TaxID=3342716 RepID=A0ABV6USP0_9ACTN|nr:DUF1906 domain-containing protein [Streptacidiphilus jeojiense]